MEDYPELREWLYTKEGIESAIKNSPYTCRILSSSTKSVCDMLSLNSKISNSLIICTIENELRSFWDYVYVNEENIPYEERLAMYLPCYLVY